MNEDKVMDLMMMVGCERCAERGRVVDFARFDCTDEDGHILTPIDPRRGTVDIKISQDKTARAEVASAVARVLSVLSTLPRAVRAEVLSCAHRADSSVVSDLISVSDGESVQWLSDAQKENGGPPGEGRAVVVRCQDGWAVREVIEAVERIDGVIDINADD